MIMNYIAVLITGGMLNVMIIVIDTGIGTPLV